MRILAHRSIQKLHLTPKALQLLQEDHLVDVVAGQAVWGCYEHPVQGGSGDGIPEPIQPRAPQRGATEAIITEHMLLLQVPALALDLRPQALKLVVNALTLAGLGGGDAGIQCYSHG